MTEQSHLSRVPIVRRKEKGTAPKSRTTGHGTHLSRLPGIRQFGAVLLRRPLLTQVDIGLATSHSEDCQESLPKTCCGRCPTRVPLKTVCEKSN